MRALKIGRNPGNDVVISNPVVSSSHAIITVADTGEIYIEDTGSKNGTFVDGARIKKARLSASSTVLLGNHAIDWKRIIQTSGQPRPPIDFPKNVVDKKLIGRNALSQIRFSFDDVSDKHAWLCKCADGSILLIDNNSTNGTYVNGRKLSSPCTLRKGDIVSLANRHPLHWEAVYPARPVFKHRILIAAMAASMALIAGILILSPWGEKDWSDVYAEHKHDVVLVYVKSAYAATVQGRPLSSWLNGYNQLDYCSIDADGSLSSGIMRSSGTGFFISPDGKLLTNRHVVSCSSEEKKKTETVKRAIQGVLIQNDFSRLAANVEVSYVILSVGIVQNDTFIDSENDLIPCTVLRISDDEDLDVALLQTNTKSIPAGSTYIDLSKAVPSDKLVLGDKICTIGFPMSFVIGQTSAGLEANNQSGEITQERGVYQYGHNITIHQGASGSPVYDKKGRFAGIIVSGFLGISQGYNHAIHPTPVLSFVEKTY
ncbi:MAG: FHA domain-containing protein [Bacteroidales bacterium]|nr:FHA domain-containing protein [Bacteroidales bacterium]